ncbi:MAG: imidazole glycerol phosphate synthase subunit HisF [Kangiellaceae bacterium]
MKNDLLPRVIVCLDVDNGRVVKGTNFKQLKDMGDPVELALEYENQGADELVFLDISATHEKRETALSLVTEIANSLSIPFTVGGGLKTINDVKAFLDSGADKVALNSTAVLKPEIINQTAKAYGSQCVVVAIDVNQEKNKLHYYINGGRKKIESDFYDWTKEVSERGAGEILLTAMHKDGTGSGFDFELTKEISNSVPIQVIASGGAKNEEHFRQAFDSGVDACLAAGMFHSGQYKVNHVKDYLIHNNIQVRI